MKSGKETERKFLLSSLPEACLQAASALIQQGYFPKEYLIRLRQCGDQFFMTVKDGGQLSRDEWETEIPDWVFEKLWPRTEGNRLTKRRYTFTYGEYTFEVDEFHHVLSGLFILEVEFSSEEAAAAFVVPDTFGIVREVTYDKRYRNRQLVLATAIPDESAP